MNTRDEEVWLARVAMILGAKELIDVALNAITVLKVRSGFLITAASADDTMAMTYLCSSLVAGLYLLAGGSFPSRLAYGRKVDGTELRSRIALPDWNGCLSVTFRAFGVHQLIQAVGSIALGIAYYHKPLEMVGRTQTPRLFDIEVAWTLEHLLIGFILLMLGGKIAGLFTGRSRPNQAPEPTALLVTRRADARHAPSSAVAHL